MVAAPRPLPLAPDRASPRLYDRAVQILTTRHYSPRTKKTYLHWMKRYIAFHGGTHPIGLGAEDVNAFLTHLAVDRKVAAATQNQALQGILFLYKHVLEVPVGWVEGIVRAKRPKNLPVVLTTDEALRILAFLKEPYSLVIGLQYGSGLRLMEALELRVKDLDFGRGELSVRRGKGGKDRVTMLPRSLYEPLQAHLALVREQHEEDLARGFGRVPMPTALARKFRGADKEWAWQRVFPARTHYTDKETGVRYRHHLHESAVQKALHVAVHRADVAKKVTTHTFRHTFATDLLRTGYDIRTVQELLGHESVRVTMKYTHVLNRGALGVRSPLDDALEHYTDPRRLNGNGLRIKDEPNPLVRESKEDPGGA